MTAVHGAHKSAQPLSSERGASLKSLAGRRTGSWVVNSRLRQGQAQEQGAPEASRKCTRPFGRSKTKAASATTPVAS